MGKYFQVKAESKEIPYKVIFKAFEKAYTEEIQEIVDEVAEKFYDKLMDNVYKQKFVRRQVKPYRKWKKLSPKYKKYKLKEDLDDRILLATHEYIDSIDVKYYGRGRKSWAKVFVPNRRHKASGLKLPVLAAIHEYGSATMKIPPRPLWRPTRLEINKYADKVCQRRMDKAYNKIKKSIGKMRRVSGR